MGLSLGGGGREKQGGSRGEGSEGMQREVLFLEGNLHLRIHGFVLGCGKEK